MHQRQQQFTQSRSTGTSTLTNTSDHRNVAFELGGRGGSAGSFSPASSTRATTSPRALHEWSAETSGVRFDSGYHTDSPMLMGSGVAASSLRAPQAARSTGGSVPPILDDQQEQFRMSLEDLRPTGVQLSQVPPPPGTFRPVSPSPVTPRSSYYFPSSRLGFGRPPSVPMADLPDNDDQLLVDEEVELVASARAVMGSGTSGEEWPDVVPHTTEIDARFRSQSVPVFPDQPGALLQEQERRNRIESSINAVARELRRIGDEISNSRGGGGTPADANVTRRTRGYSVSHSDRQQNGNSSDAARRRMSTGPHTATAVSAAAAAHTGGQAAFSYPSYSADAGAHSVQHARRANYGSSAGGSSDSWLDRIHRLIRTLSGADIADAEATDSTAAAAGDEAEDEVAIGAVGGGLSGGGGGHIRATMFDDYGQDEY